MFQRAQDESWHRGSVRRGIYAATGRTADAGVPGLYGATISLAVCALAAWGLTGQEQRLRRGWARRLGVTLGCVAAGAVSLGVPSKTVRHYNRIAGQHVILPAGTPDAFRVTSPAIGPFRRIAVKNPPGAITFVFDVKKTFPEFFEDQQYFLHGFADVDFDIDNNPRTGLRGDDRPDGFEVRAMMELTAYAHGAFSQWTTANENLRRVEAHYANCRLMDLGPPKRLRHDSMMKRVKIDGTSLQFTALYSELGVSPQRTIRIAIIDRSRGVTEKVMQVFTLALR